jgi:predicted SAM-dependent methyltransferase
MLKGLIKARTTQGVRDAARRLADELRYQRLHRASLKAALRYEGQTGLKLNLGCGPNPKPGWVNIDLTETADLRLDLREPLPFRDGSASFIYTEHFFEHLEYPVEAERLLREAVRVLEPGGTLSVGVPDAEAPLLAYAADIRAGGEERAAGAEARRRLSEEPHNRWVPGYVFTTPLHMVNWPFRQGTEHKYAYDFETLRGALAGAGFVRIERREFNPDLDSETRREGTLYVEGRKPE